MDIPGLVPRTHVDGLSGTHHLRWDVTTPKALETLLTNSGSPSFVDELTWKARGMVRNEESYQADGITKVTRRRGKKNEFNVEVTLFRLEPNGDTSTRKVVVPVIDPDCYSDYDLRAVFGKPVLRNS